MVRFLPAACVFLGVVWWSGCGKRPGIGVTDPDADGSFVYRDGASDGTTVLPDGAPVRPPCAQMAWSECFSRLGPIVVSESSDMGDVAWTGNRFLVIAEKEWGNEVVAIDQDGVELFRADVGGIQFPRITWNPLLNVGLAVVDSGVRWLDGNGRPVGDYVSAGVEGYQLGGDVGAVADGFWLFNGANVFGTPPPFEAAKLGASPGPVGWIHIEEIGPRAPAEHVNGPDGLAQYVASTVWWQNVGELYRVGPSGLEVVEVLDGILPQDGEGFVVGLSEYAGRLFMLYAGAPSGTLQVWSQWVVELVGPAYRTWRIDESHNGSDGHMLNLAGTLLIASSSIHPEYRVSIAPFDPSDPVNPLGPLNTVAPGFSRTPRMVGTNRGFGIVWWEDGGLYLQNFECCTETPPL